MLELLQKINNPWLALSAASGFILLVFLLTKPGTEISILGTTFTKRDSPLLNPFSSIPGVPNLDYKRLKFARHFTIKLCKYLIVFYSLYFFCPVLVNFLFDRFEWRTWNDFKHDFDEQLGDAFLGAVFISIALIFKFEIPENDEIAHRAHQWSSRICVGILVLLSVKFSILTFEYFNNPKFLSSMHMSSKIRILTITHFITIGTLHVFAIFFIARKRAWPTPGP